MTGTTNTKDTTTNGSGVAGCRPVPATRGVEREDAGEVSRKRYYKKESRERGTTAIAASVVAIALLAGTWLYVHRQTSEGHHAHVSVHLVLADIATPFLAAWLAWDWVRYSRGLKRSMPRAPGVRSTGGRGKRKRDG